uniref:NET domain-containing protein n=2 Tax=Caenorhabditis tropicalis TaxID=1561998 RepID=A0A1I7U2Z4_9PELO
MLWLCSGENSLILACSIQLLLFQTWKTVARPSKMPVTRRSTSLPVPDDANNTEPSPVENGKKNGLRKTSPKKSATKRVAPKQSIKVTYQDKKELAASMVDLPSSNICTVLRIIQLGQHEGGRQVDTLRSLSQKRVDFSTMPAKMVREMKNYMDLLDKNESEKERTEVQITYKIRFYGIDAFDEKFGIIPNEALKPIGSLPNLDSLKWNYSPDSSPQKKNGDSSPEETKRIIKNSTESAPDASDNTPPPKDELENTEFCLSEESGSESDSSSDSLSDSSPDSPSDSDSDSDSYSDSDVTSNNDPISEVGPQFLESFEGPCPLKSNIQNNVTFATPMREEWLRAKNKALQMKKAQNAVPLEKKEAVSRISGNIDIGSVLDSDSEKRRIFELDPNSLVNGVRIQNPSNNSH